MENLSSVDALFIESVIGDVSVLTEHKFSLRYRVKKRKIIRIWEKAQKPTVKARHAMKMKYAIIAIIVSCAAILGGFGLYKLFGRFRMTDYDIFSMLSVYDEAASYPNTISEKFYLDMDMSEYTVEIMNDIDIVYWVCYEKDGLNICINQKPVSVFGQVRLNTENALSVPTPLIINDWEGVHFMTHSDVNCYIFNTGKYILTYTGNISDEDMESIINATRF